MAEQMDQKLAPVAGRTKIFLSYTRAEIDDARKIITLLEQADMDVWWDGLLEGGVTYLRATEAALEGADCVVVLWSKLSVESSWVRDEAQSGRERGCLVPLSLDGTMAPLGFRQIQLIDISGWNGGADAREGKQIVAAIQSQTGAQPDGGVISSPAKLPAQPAGISRRALALGGLGIAGGAVALGAWQMGLFTSAGAATESMAVLPFANIGDDDEQSWFTDGLSNELRQVLARNPNLRVSAPTSSSALAGEDDFEIGRALKVRNILRGSVRLVENTVRIVPELIRVDDGLVLWGNIYNRDFSDILAVQTEIAETVALELVAAVGGGQTVGGTEDVRAYEAYLRGNSFYDLSAGGESDRAALLQFDAAIELDPDYAAAHAMRATMLAAIASTTPDLAEVGVLYENSIAAARKAIELEPNLARGHLALGFSLMNGNFDPASAYPSFKKADELAPGDADTQRSVASFYNYGDQQALAMQMIDRVLELDPLNARAFRTAGFIALFARDYSMTTDRMNRALELNPQLVSAQYGIANARLMQGDITGAQQAFAAEPVSLLAQTGEAITQFKLNDKVAARSAFAELIAEYGDSCLYQQAQVHAQWGETARALEVLESAFSQKDPGALLARNDPLLDPLRSEPGFDQLLLPLSS